VKLCEARGGGLDVLTRADLLDIEPRLENVTLPDLSVEGSVASRTSAGGTSPVRVKEAIAKARQELGL
jgi:argininosuccinate lyase